MPIKGFFNQYRFLSNFYPCSISYQGLDFYHVEGAYQAAKTIHSSIHPTYSKHISTLRDPRKAKKLGKIYPLRPDWKAVKYDIMWDLIRRKFSKKPLSSLLLNTKNEYLEESNKWHDLCWGKCYCEVHKGEGDNDLGSLLMLVRYEVRDKVGMENYYRERKEL